MTVEEDQGDRVPHGEAPGGGGAPMATAQTRHPKRKRPAAEVCMTLWKVTNRLLQGGGITRQSRLVVVAAVVLDIDVRRLAVQRAGQHIP